MASGYPDYEGGKAGVYSVAEWAAFEGKEITLNDSAVNVAWNGNETLNNVVAAGKTIYINQACFYCQAFLQADADNNQMCQLQIYRSLPGPVAWYALVTSNGGGQLTFPRPLKFIAGDTLTAIVYNRANHNVNIGMTLTGYEI